MTASGSSSGRLDVELLLAHVMGWSRSELLAHPERALSKEEESAFRALVERRAAHEPIAFLLGEREFYGRLFKVDRRALIPRPETELLVDLGREAVSEWRQRGVEPRVVDVGTGSGAVAISVALECDLHVVATDVSAEALALAKENAYHRGAPRVWLVQTDLLGGLREPLHVVLANLPYVPSSRDLPPDVANYEPAVALFGGTRGTELIERLLHEARALLVSGSVLAVELDEEAQAAPIADLASSVYASARVSVLRDAGGYDRVVRVTLA